MIELNEYGLAIWINRKNPDITATKSYWWCKSAILLNERTGRSVVGFIQLSELEKSEWIPLSKEGYEKTKT